MMIDEKGYAHPIRFEPGEQVFVISKEYPLAFSVIEKQTRSGVEGYYLSVLNESLKVELGVDKLWLPSRMIFKFNEA